MSRLVCYHSCISVSENGNETRIIGPVTIKDNNFVTAIHYSDNFEVSFEFKAFAIPSGGWHQILIGK